ncbi:MAG: diphthamide synthesis protein [archaeon]|nr:MAG: diphthamide synthesis protein [archaeon]
MKVLFVPTQSNVSISDSIIQKISRKLPKKIGIISTIQFSYLINQFRSVLRREGKSVFVDKKGLILGCDVKSGLTLQNKVDVYLYIGSGRFHTLALALELKNQKPIFIFNPSTLDFYEFNWDEVKKIKQKQKAAHVKFLSEDKIGIIVSTKSGQNNLSEAFNLKKQFEKKKKKSYIFLTDNFDLNQLENFPEIKSWVNTACPGLSRENPSLILDFRNIKKG